MNPNDFFNKKKLCYRTHSAKHTERIGEEFVKWLKGGEVLALIGEFGSGKTTFVKGIAKGLGIKKTIQSPSFVLIKEYEVKTNKRIKKLYHVDLFRLKEEPDFYDLEEILLTDTQTLTVIEWAERLKNLLSKISPIIIKFKIISKTKREILISDSAIS
jgi:tRNA threonylcarbamoyladenosine biosynthesis protein TsaE